MSTQTSSYKLVKAVSNSALTQFEDNIRIFRDWWLFDVPFKEEDEEHLIIGSLVDTLLTRKDHFNDIYFVFEEAAPKPQMVTFCKKLLPIYNPQGDIEAQLRTAYTESNIKSPGLDNVKEKFKSECQKYFNALRASSRKTVITNDQYSKAKKITEELQSNEFTSEIINALSNDNTSVYNQLEIFTHYRCPNGTKIPVKGALDKVIVNHISKTVYPYDLKTSFSLNEFLSSYIKYNYFRQSSYYTSLLQFWMKEKGLKDYRLAEFKFIVTSTSGEGSYLYKVSRTDILRGMRGGVTAMGLAYKGWETLLNEIGWHIDTGKWDYPYEVYRNNGVLTLFAFKYELNALNNVA